MFVKQFIHVQKKIVKGMIDIIFFDMVNETPVFFKIVQYKLLFIEIWPKVFINIGFRWRRVKKLMEW